MKKTLLFFALVTLPLIGTNAQSKAVKAAALAKVYVAKMDSALNLSSEQEKEIEKLYVEREKELRAIDKTTKDAEIAERIKIRKKYYLKQQAILNPSQKTALKKDRKAHETVVKQKLSSSTTK